MVPEVIVLISLFLLVLLLLPSFFEELQLYRPMQILGTFGIQERLSKQKPG